MANEEVSRPVHLLLAGHPKIRRPGSAQQPLALHGYMEQKCVQATEITGGCELVVGTFVGTSQCNASSPDLYYTGEDSCIATSSLGLPVGEYWGLPDRGHMIT